MQADRAVTSTVSVALLVAILAVLAAVVGTSVLDFADTVEEPAPTVAQSTGSFEPQDGDDGGIVRRHLEAGDRLQTRDLVVIVDATDACGKTGRLVNLPLESNNRIDDDNVASDDVFDGRSLNDESVSGDDPGVLLEDEYAAGETLLFRIPDVDWSVDAGDQVVVTVVHQPSNSVVVEKTLTA